MADTRNSARLVMLVSTAVFINYVDRGNLSTGATLIQEQLSLNEAQLGILFSAFYYGYVPIMPLMGVLAERFGAKPVFAAGLALWSVATMLTGFAGGFISLLLLRVLLGVGESGAFPCASKVLAAAVQPSRLGVANGVLSFGYLIGPAVGTFLGGLLMARIGWRPVFFLFGLASLFWLIPWLRTEVPKPVKSAVGLAGPSLKTLLRERALWGASIGHFASNYGYYFIVSWLPFYLVKARGYSLDTMSLLASMAYLLNAGSAFGMGALADRWLRRGISATTVYKSIMGISHAGAVVCMIGMMTLGETGSIVSLFAFEIIAGASYPGLFAIPQIIAGPEAAGRWVGLQNAAGNVAGLIAPTVTGFLVYSTGHFGLAFGLVAALNVLGCIGWVWVLPAVAAIDWNQRQQRVRA
jgi:MFS family permease